MDGTLPKKEKGRPPRPSEPYKSNQNEDTSTEEVGVFREQRLLHKLGRPQPEASKSQLRATLFDESLFRYREHIKKPLTGRM